MPRALSYWLSVGLSALVTLCVLLVTLVILGVLMPRLNTEVDAQNQMLARAAATQIDNFLADFSSQLRRLSGDISSRPVLSAAELRSMVDTVTNAKKGIESIYVVDSKDLVVEVGLPKEGRGLRENQRGVDFSSRRFALLARESGQATWSDTYLSVRGNIVVALAVPLTIPGSLATEPASGGVLVGELNLHEVSRFAGLLSTPGSTLTVVMDRRGNVVGHPDAERALRQENLAHLAPLSGAASGGKTASFSLDDTDYLGSTTTISETGWIALVGQPTIRAFAIVRSTLFSLALASALALVLAVIAALAASRRIMEQVGVFSARMEAVADGRYSEQITPFAIEEIENLSQKMRRMADVVRQRESSLRESEMNFRLLIESVPQGIAVVDEDGRFILVNAFFTHLFGDSLHGASGLPVWWKNVCPDHASQENTISLWHALQNGDGALTSASHLFQFVGVDGVVRDIEFVAVRLPDSRVLLTFSDITERRKNELRLQRAAKVFSHAREGIVITDPAGRIVEVNETFTRLTGYGSDNATGRRLVDLKLSPGDDTAESFAWASLVEKGFWHGEFWFKGEGGVLYGTLMSIAAVCDVQGTVQNYVGLFTDITQMKEYQRQLEHVAHFDPLTGLPNRVLLADRLNQAMTQSLRRDLSLAVLYLDLDGFKPINDHYGHGTGDRTLFAIAQRLKEVVRDGDTVARIGGDEFVIVLVDLDQEQDCEPVLERLLEAVSNPMTIDSISVQVSASVGVTYFPRDCGDADLLMRHADQAMYQAKQSGKNRYCVFDVALDAAAVGHLRMLEQIRNGLQKHEFVLYYQPKVNMRSGTVIGVEALIRWHHPERGLLSPAAFLPVIDDLPISIDLGEWVIETALGQIGRWREAGLDLPVSVNVGAHQLLAGDFEERLAALLAAHADVPSDRLELEIVETSALEDVQRVSELMYACLDQGVSFSLDDFGTGYSSLTYLKRLPAGMLKIDQSFVRGMLEDPDDRAIVSGVIGLSSVFHRQVIAEGVETVEHGVQLLALGCSLVQGYGVARPMPASDIPVWVERWRPPDSWVSAPVGDVSDAGQQSIA